MAKENEFSITRELDAPRKLVFKVWTEAQHLVHWWGPKGLKCIVKKLDFKPGGIFHYCMQAPDGKEMWGKIVYREIVTPERIELIVSFADANEEIVRHPLAPSWPLELLNVLRLTEHAGKTILTLRSLPINPTEEECNTFYSNFEGMNQGFKGTFDQLENYLKKISLNTH